MKRILIVLFVILITFVISTIVYGKEINQKKTPQYIEVIVQEGDTLWSIAKPYYNGKMDFRELIYNIRELNELSEAMIYPGQVLKIPLD
ncbi:LysM peptidoglycan-binding domain-containing protein [Tepidibacillus infernus]|uniref:LysM domain-containing protein n=1 Tax=Tepidibacillus decaturensis TaxID=1413211 RepID=A0A135L3B9_9BACI|nr:MULTISPECIES: LysM peptidoglycan-binding domain-containing protein [Tepidibacillus]KXG43485.1 hypothetical protein U473_05245 [Tepidibacillus decaturensis]GBF11350.1 cell division suppressor protein YneA [Tepidibacillus sp. HK-1]